jgi:hypothetical protein
MPYINYILQEILKVKYEDGQTNNDLSIGIRFMMKAKKCIIIPQIFYNITESEWILFLTNMIITFFPV